MQGDGGKHELVAFDGLRRSHTWELADSDRPDVSMTELAAILWSLVPHVAVEAEMADTLVWADIPVAPVAADK
jgi:hypothetical protein